MISKISKTLQKNAPILLIIVLLVSCCSITYRIINDSSVTNIVLTTEYQQVRMDVNHYVNTLLEFAAYVAIIVGGFIIGLYIYTSFRERRTKWGYR